ncbi:hypothetical protein phiRKBJ001_80 [Streptomyces phage phiRKBJ001]|nr:hypothetical protein phiRKBJ001_80 [Streptomyces phage phiRKBJ001]
MDLVWNIYKVIMSEDREEHTAVFTDEDKANDAINRLRLRDENLEDVDYNLRYCSVNPTPEMLELPKTLREMGCDDLLKAAYIELCNDGKMYVPLWINPAWLVHELKAKYDLGIDFKGREMKLVSKSELLARRRHGIPDVNAPSDFGTDAAESAAYDRDDAGFVESDR